MNNATHRVPFERFIKDDDETRLHRVYAGLSALRDLCTTHRAPNNIADVQQIGYLIEIVTLDLGQVALGQHGEQISYLAD